MNSKKSTKRALISSVLSLVICMTMLIGTTFAWFTDSVTSTNNIIKSGNLDVELEYSTDMSNWNKVTETTNIFKEGALWEPGYTEVVYLRVSNLGSLALKYNLGVNIESETQGINKAGEKFSLSDYIQFGVIDPVTAAFASREVAREAVTDAKKISSGYTKEGRLLAKADGASEYPSNVVAMVVYMPEAIGNEANHNGTAPEIKIGLNLLATQVDAEYDSFGNNYDAWLDPVTKYVSNYDDLVNAINEGGKVQLMSDINVEMSDMNTTAASIPVALAITGGADVELDLNGKSITAEGNGTDTTALIFVHDSNLTITGDGSLNQNADGFIVWGKGNSTVNVMSGNFNGGKSETSVFYASSNEAYKPESGYATINVYGGNFDSVSKDNPADKQNIANVMNHGAGRINFYGGSYGWDPSSAEFVHVDDRKYVVVAEGYKTIENGGLYVVVTGKTEVVETSDDLKNELATGNDVFMTENIKVPSAESNAYGKTGINVTNGQTIDGNGKTLSVNGANGTWDSAINTTGGTIKNLKIDSGFRGIFVNHNSEKSAAVILENVIIDGPVYTISCDQGTKQGLTATNCTFNGWTSYAATIGDVVFENCNFGEGAGYAFCRPYAPTTFVGCDFAEGYKIDARAAVTFENCTVGGVTLTAENLSTLVTSNLANATVK